MSLIDRFERWWRERQRGVDLKLLWPICKAKASDIEQARAAFAVHAFEDPAWREDYSHDELVTYISNMT